jgi:catechol 2,3-dioxygenase-like lactoylglutathione lyase family enzyme
MATVSHMVLPVTDLQKSRNWYVDRLGFTLEREQDGVVSIKDAAGLTVFLQSVTDALPGRKITLTIEVDDVHRKHEELERGGVRFVSLPKMLFWGYGAEVLDPDGYMNHLWDKVTMSQAMRNRGETN